MSTCLCIGGLLIAADAAAWVLSAQSGDSRWVVLITSGTTVVVALCTAVVLAAPHVGKAATAFAAAVMPVLQLIHKQNEEIRKGSLTGQLDDLKHLLTKAEADRAASAAAQAEASLKAAEANERLKALAEQNVKLQQAVEADRARTEDANKKLHDIRNEFNVATLQHQEQREALIAELGAVRVELTAARAEVAEFHRRDQARISTVVAGQARQDVKIEQNRAAVDSVTATVERIAGNSSGEMPVVKVDPPSKGDADAR